MKLHKAPRIRALAAILVLFRSVLSVLGAHVFCSLLRVTGCDACSRCRPSSCATHCLPVFTSCYRLDQSSAFVRTTYICFAPAARACVPLFFLIADSWAHLCSGPAPAIGRVAASELSSPLASRHARRRASPGTAPRPWRSCWPIPCRIRRLRFSSVCLARCLFFSALLSGEDLPRPYHCRSGCWIGQCLTRFHGLVSILFWIHLCLRSFQSHIFVAVPICRFFWPTQIRAVHPSRLSGKLPSSSRCSGPQTTAP